MAYRRQQIILVVALDLSAAFDQASKKAIIYKLANKGLKGTMLKWLENFLQDRKFRVTIEDKVSSWKPISSSVPQGSPASPTLFNILLSDAPKISAKYLIYAADITLYITASKMEEAKADMQNSINTLNKWCSHWGQEINPAKSSMTYFSHNKQLGTGPQLQVNDQIIPYSKNTKILGLTFDSPNLTWSCGPVPSCLLWEK